jgi:hypothetical protein
LQWNGERYRYEVAESEGRVSGRAERGGHVHACPPLLVLPCRILAVQVIVSETLFSLCVCLVEGS